METHLTPKVTKIAGTPKEGSWSQVFWQEPADEEKKSLRGSLAAVVEVEAREELESASLGREVFEILEKEYLNSSKGDVLEALEQALKSANDHLYKVLATFPGEDISEHPKYGILVASLWGKVLYLAGVGGANAYLAREGKIQSVLKIAHGENVEVFDESKVHTASGYVQEGDVVILASSGFQDAVSGEEILKLVSEAEEIDDVTDFLAPKIKSLDDSSKIAALFLKIAFAKVPTSEEEEIAIAKESKKSEPEETPLPKPENEEELSQKSPPKEENGWLDGQIALPPKEKAKVENQLIEKIKGIFLLFGDKFPRFGGQKKFYARDWGAVREKRKKIIFGFLAVLVVILLLSFGFGIRQKKVSSDRTSFEAAMSQASSKFDEAKSVETLNKEQARKLYSEALDKISEAKKYNLDKDRVSKLEADAKAGYEGSLDLFAVAPSVFLDLSLAKENFAGEKMAFYGSRALVWDSALRSLIKLEIPTKSAEVVAGGDEFSGVKSVALWEDSAFLVSPDNGVWKVDVAKKDKTKIIEKDSDWQEIFTSGAFLGNVYLADRKANQIWKYSPIASGYSDKIKYLTNDTNFDNAMSWTIDGSIWILRAEGTILKFNQGKKIDFALSGFDEKLSSKAIIFTEADAVNFYILDLEKSKLFIFDKEGKYLSQYKIDGVGPISDFVVYEKDKICLLLSGKNLYSFEIK